jgi:hypothetical protein
MEINEKEPEILYYDQLGTDEVIYNKIIVMARGLPPLAVRKTFKRDSNKYRKRKKSMSINSLN